MKNGIFNKFLDEDEIIDLTVNFESIEEGEVGNCEVEKILEEVYDTGGKEMYLLKWKDWVEDVDKDWVDKEELENCTSVLEEWKKSRKKLVLVRDFQKELQIPKFQLQPEDLYCKRKLYLHNMGIYCCNTKEMRCLLWSEYDGDKRQDDVISALWNYYKPQLSPNQHLISWSDNCVSQNTARRILFFHT